MKLFKSSLVALALTAATNVYAESIAITNATVHTMTEQGTLTNATVIFDNGVITAINPSSVEADKTVDAKGRILTPGLIGSMNQLGLVEVGAVSRTRDMSEKKADITFDASTAFNPNSSVIPYSRKGGITSNVVIPYGGSDMFKGQAFVVDLSGTYESVTDTGVAAIVDLGSKSKGSRAYEIQKLKNKLEDAQEALAKAKKKDKKDDKKSDKKPKRDAKIINDILAGDTPLIAYADRATDILALIDIKKTFDVNLVIVGAGDAILVADKLAEANIPVIISAIKNLPSFDAMHASLENPAKLFEAGVKVAYRENGDTHNLYMLRYDAGISVANGVSKDDALAAITSNVADVFNLDTGRIAVGKRADMVLWSGDPFELSTKVDHMWINGVDTSTQSRQDELRNRYTTDSAMPRAYTK